VHQVRRQHKSRDDEEGGREVALGERQLPQRGLHLTGPWQRLLATSYDAIHLKKRGFIHLKPSLRFQNSFSEGPHMIGAERTDILSTNHMRAFSN